MGQFKELMGVKQGHSSFIMSSLAYQMNLIGSHVEVYTINSIAFTSRVKLKSIVTSYHEV